MDTALYSFMSSVAENGKMRSIPVVRQGVAALLWSLAPREPGSRVLELGTGMGYSAAIMAVAMGLCARIPQEPYRFEEPNHPLAEGILSGYDPLDAYRKAESSVIVTVDRDPRRVVEAMGLLRSIGADDRTSVIHADCLDAMANLSSPFDLVFLDAGKSENRSYIEALTGRNLLRPGGTVVIDNIDFGNGGDTSRSRRIRADIAGFADWFGALRGWRSVYLETGDGVIIGTMAGNGAPDI